MKLTKICIETIQGKRDLILKLALELGFSELWVNKLLDANKENGPLTTAKALQLIRESTGLLDQEILIEAVKEVDSKSN